MLFSVKANVPLDALLDRFLSAVPVFPEQDVRELVMSGATFADILEHIRSIAPLEMMIYWQDAVGPLMKKAGNYRSSHGFLVGNLRMLSTLFDRDPRVLAFVPFRVTLSDDLDGGSWFTAEMPGNGLRLLDDSAIAEAAPKIDAKLLTIMTAMSLEIPTEASAQLTPHLFDEGGREEL